MQTNNIFSIGKIPINAPFKQEFAYWKFRKLNLKNKYDFYCINYANPDMVGHTGSLKSGIKACECVDAEIGKLYKEVSKKKGTLIITSDHGNAEEMINLKTSEVDTKHSINPVPFIITLKDQKLRKNGCLGNIAPTILDLMDVK